MNGHNGLYVCHECNVYYPEAAPHRFAARRALRQHEKSNKHRAASHNDGPDRVACPACQSTFTRLDSLAVHQQKGRCPMKHACSSATVDANIVATTNLVRPRKRTLDPSTSRETGSLAQRPGEDADAMTWQHDYNPWIQDPLHASSAKRARAALELPCEGLQSSSPASQATTGAQCMLPELQLRGERSVPQALLTEPEVDESSVKNSMCLEDLSWIDELSNSHDFPDLDTFFPAAPTSDTASVRSHSSAFSLTRVLRRILDEPVSNVRTARVRTRQRLNARQQICCFCKKPYEMDERALREYLDRHIAELGAEQPGSRCIECDVSFVHQKDLDHHLTSVKVSGTCGFNFKHGTACQCHHPVSGDEHTGWSVHYRFRYGMALRAWELAQLQHARQEVARVTELRSYRLPRSIRSLPSGIIPRNLDFVCSIPSILSWRSTPLPIRNRSSNPESNTGEAKVRDIERHLRSLYLAIIRRNVDHLRKVMVKSNFLKIWESHGSVLLLMALQSRYTPAIVELTRTVEHHKRINPCEVREMVRIIDAYQGVFPDGLDALKYLQRIHKITPPGMSQTPLFHAVMTGNVEMVLIVAAAQLFKSVDRWPEYRHRLTWTPVFDAHTLFIDCPTASTLPPQILPLVRLAMSLFESGTWSTSQTYHIVAALLQNQPAQLPWDTAASAISQVTHKMLNLSPSGRQLILLLLQKSQRWQEFSDIFDYQSEELSAADVLWRQVAHRLFDIFDSEKRSAGQGLLYLTVCG